MNVTDRSTHPTVVEYGVHEMFKRKSPAAAARATAKKHSGFENMFFGPGVTLIDAKVLEEALWNRIVEQARKNLSRFKPGAERMALLSALDHFRQPEKSLAQLEARLARPSRDAARRYLVYVAEVPSATGTTYYVGSTAKRLPKRRVAHRRGLGGHRRHMGRIRQIGVYPTREKAEAAERIYAARLRRHGLTVENA